MMENDQKLGLYEVYGDKTNLSEKDSEIFFDAINNPTQPVDALIEAKERYEESLKKKSLKS
jgi:hypothetical protein